MRKLLFIVSALLVFSTASYGQFADYLKKSEVHGSFEVDGMYYHADEAMGITDSIIDGRNFGFNGFASVTYSLGKFSAGMRYEAYLPPIAGFDPKLEGSGFPNLWASYNSEKLSFTVGNFYEQFGNGLIMRTYEEWTLGYDNSINGARVVITPVKGLILKGVYGTQRYFWSKYEKNNRGIVKGADIELNFNDAFQSMESSKLRLSLGASAVSKYQVDEDPIYKLPRNVASFAGRMNMGLGRVNFSTEYAYKINDPSAMNEYIYKPGQALIASISYSTRGFGAFAMFKRIDNMSYKSDRTVTSNALDISYLPAITEAHTYMLAAMYPYATQLNGEIGYQLQINYKVPKKSKLGGKYGMGISVNYSQVNDIVRTAPSDTTEIGVPGTLGYESDFFKFSDHVFYRDLNIEIDKKFSKKFKGTFTYIYQDFDIATIQGHTGEPMITSHIGIADITYKFTSKKALRAEIQGLFTDQDKGDWAAILLEYTISPHWFFSVADQYNYGNPIQSDQLHFYTGSFGYTHKTSRISVTYGRQREGVVCVGGVCRNVPASSGFYVTLSSSF